MDSDWYGAETFEASGCVGCQMQKPVSKDERAAIQKQVEKFNEQLALDPDDDFERYILLDLDDETLIEDAFFKRQGAWRPLTEAFRKRWGKRSELMDKISLAQFGEKSDYAIYSFEKPFWFEYECDPQDTATAEDPEGYGLGFEFDMTKEEAIEKARQIHKETKGAITMYNNARKRSGGGSTRIHPKFWATPEMMEEQKKYYEREDMKWPTGDALTDWSWEDKDEVFNVEFNEWADQEMNSHGKNISFKDWAEDEGMKHGNTEITEWAQHEDESHDARYGAETFEDCEVCYATVDKGTLNDVQAGRICNECHKMNQYDAESFEAKGYAPDKPFYATTHENGYTTVMHPIKCGHYKMVMNGTGVWMPPTFYDTIEEMFTTEFDNIMDSQYGGMVEWAMSDPRGKETIRKYKDIKTIGDARKFAKKHFDFKIDFAPCFRKERNYDSKALNALPITVHPFWIDDGGWADEYSDALREFQAERKKRSSLLSEPHEGTSLDSGEWKGILTGFGIGLLGLFGYSKLRK